MWDIYFVNKNMFSNNIYIFNIFFQKIANEQYKILSAALFKITKKTNNLETKCLTIKDYLNT